MSEPMRLQKWLAEAGLCSRREGEKWIAAGRVSINGKVVTETGNKVKRGDKVSVDGRPVQHRSQPLLVLALNKPPGIICTRKDSENRRTVFDLLEDPSSATGRSTKTAFKGRNPTDNRLINIGRLDYNSEGLILFTNHGDLAHGLMHPSNQVPRTYRVRVHGRIDDAMLTRLRAGVALEDGHTGPINMEVDRVPGANSWVTMTLQEGRNRIVRRIFAAVDMDVSRLIRISYGNFSMGDLPKGRWRALQSVEVTQLLAHVNSIKITPPPDTDEQKERTQTREKRLKPGKERVQSRKNQPGTKSSRSSAARSSAARPSAARSPSARPSAARSPSARPSSAQPSSSHKPRRQPSRAKRGHNQTTQA